MLFLKLFHDCGFGIGQVEAETRRDEQRKFGVFFDDDYNYLQHLKEASAPSELVAAVSLFHDREPLDLQDEEEYEGERDVSKDTPVSLL